MDLTENILRTGKLAPSVRNGQYLNPLMMAPGGFWRVFELHPYLGAGLHKVFSFFNKDFPLMLSLSFLPVILFGLSVSLFVFLSARLKFGALVTFIGGVFFALSPVHIQRSSFGWYDTDPYNIIAMLLALILIDAIIRNPPDAKNVVTLGLLSGFYAILWQGWLLIVILSLIGLLYVSFSEKRAEYKRPPIHLKNLLLYLASMTVFAFIVLTPAGFLYSLGDLGDIVARFLFLKRSYWPDIFLTVGELSAPSLLKIFHVLGGILLLPLACAGLALVLLSKDGRKSPQKMIICIFFILMALMSKSAQRFIILLLVPASFLLMETTRRLELLIKPKIFSIALLFAVALPVGYAHISASGELPIFNSVWEKVLSDAAKMTPPDSIINTWWPPGHFIKAVAKRRVTFDGATMNTPQAYWMAVALLSDNEKESVGVLRMLNTSGNYAAEYLAKQGVPITSAITLLRGVVQMDKKQAYEKAAQRLGPDKAKTLISLTHGQAPPSYCLVYNDLAESLIGLYYVKNWNFDKAGRSIDERLEKLKKGGIFWRGSKANIDGVWAVAGGMPYIGPESPMTSVSDNVIKFANGVTLDTSSMSARFNDLENKISGVPASIVYTDDNGTLLKKDMPGRTVRLSIVFVRSRKSVFCVVTPPDIVFSTFIKLYYFGGKGLTSFERTAGDENPALKTNLILYRVKWPE
jgi:asparagine N-glycosylation enzyme membrane subunit Stt3